jgi:hypothetical protein
LDYTTDGKMHETSVVKILKKAKIKEKGLKKDE